MLILPYCCLALFFSFCFALYSFFGGFVVFLDVLVFFSPNLPQFLGVCFKLSLLVFLPHFVGKLSADA